MNSPGLSILLSLCGAAAAAPLVAAAEPPPWIIHPIGDSITHGMDRDGYRRPLADLLRARKVDFHFVGTLSHGSPGAAEPLHDGHDGWTIDRVTNEVEGWLTHFRPHVLLVMIGANDIELGADLPTLIARYRALLTKITAAAPNARVLISEVTLIRESNFDRAAVAFNRELEILIKSEVARGRRLTFVPMHDVLKSYDLRDLDHPTTSGNAKLAERWWTLMAPIF